MSSQPSNYVFRLFSHTIFVWVCGWLCGCHFGQKTFVVERPAAHRLQTDAFVIQSNFSIEKDAPLIQELTKLKHQVMEELQLPKQRDPVVVYLFSDEESYRRYMQTTWPELPDRRAYFVGTKRELSVYSYHSAFVEEDLRHEFTHGLLHACLNTVPLWLDEGLAEYFEVRGTETGLPHASHIQLLRTVRNDGWNPSLYRLEQLADFKKMTQQDYAESWGWVHYMLHSSEQNKQVLLNYLKLLQQRSVPPKLLPDLEAADPSYFNGLIAHVAAMHNDRAQPGVVTVRGP